MNCLLHLFRHDPALGLTVIIPASTVLPGENYVVLPSENYVQAHDLCLAEIMSLQLSGGGAHSATESLLGIPVSPLEIKIKAALQPYFTCPHTLWWKWQP